jgi:hypothetical protein
MPAEIPDHLGVDWQEGNVAAKDIKLSPEQVRASLFIDFEGEGNKKGATGHMDQKVLPHMLGVYEPKTKNSKSLYRAFLFRPEWKPVANGSRHKVVVADFRQTLRMLIDEVNDRSGKLIHFSPHEAEVVRHFLPELYEAFHSVSVNIKPLVDKMYNRRYPRDTQSRPGSLAEYMRFYFPKIPLNELKNGASDACQRVDKAARKHTRWRSWPEKKQELAKNLIEYNRSDCHATWKLANKVANYQLA